MAIPIVEERFLKKIRETIEKRPEYVERKIEKEEKVLCPKCGGTMKYKLTGSVSSNSAIIIV